MQNVAHHDQSTVPEGVPFVRGKRRPAVWQLVAENIYPHRSRKQQDEDEIMVCQCKPVFGSDCVGCGEHCLNRMLNIECVEKYCPNGARCSNQIFSRRMYAPIEIRRAGKKGFGLFTKKDLKAGEFIVEYVGEVLDEEEYARRKQFYEASAQRHYYFMNIGNGEVIDATRKGGMGRFINHSCEPNCETQKWVVKGELSIGLFATKDISAGSELSFDYNFERYGDKPVKCLCGSTKCRGLIGGERETAEKLNIEISGPEEEEDLEPIMVTETDEDRPLAEILDRVVGLGWEDGWTPMLQQKLEKLAKSKGIQLPKYLGEMSTASVDDEAFLQAAAKSAMDKLPEGSRKSRNKYRIQRASSVVDPDWKEIDRKTDKKQKISKPSRTSKKLIKTYTELDRVAIRKPGFERYAPRSEVQRRLDVLVGKSGRLKDTSRDSIVFLLRLFNLCDLGPSSRKSVDRNKTSDIKELKEQDLNLRNGATHLHPERELARQGARIVDISLLLDAVLKTDSLTAKRGFVECGLLRQLAPIMVSGKGSPSGEHAVIIRKSLKTIENLPITADIVNQTRSAHGDFGELLRELTCSPDFEVRNKAVALLKKWSLSPVENPKYSNRTDTYGSYSQRQGRFTSGELTSSHNKPSTYTPRLRETDSHNRFVGSIRSNQTDRSDFYSSQSSDDRKITYDRYETARNDSYRFDSDERPRKIGRISRWDTTSGQAPPPPPPPPQPTSSPAIAEPQFSPMTDDEEEEGMIPQNEKLPARGNEPKSGTDDVFDLKFAGPSELIKDPFEYKQDDETGKSKAKDHLETWDSPDASFENFVAEVVRKRVGKYELPDRPAPLSRDDAASLFKKIRREIMAKEYEAYKLRQSSGSIKPIERGKVEQRIKDYVRDSVHKFQTQHA